MSRSSDVCTGALAWAVRAALVAAGVALWLLTLGAVSVHIEALDGRLAVRLPGWWR